jgi:hypothetical protein
MLFIDHEVKDPESFKLELTAALGPNAKRLIFINKAAALFNKKPALLKVIKEFVTTENLYIADFSRMKEGFLVLSRDKKDEPEKKIHLWPFGQGAGTELKKILAKFGIVATVNCTCNAKANKMDAEGVDWCEANIPTILGWLREEGLKRWNKRLKTWQSGRFLSKLRFAVLYNKMEPLLSKLITPMMNFLLTKIVKIAIKRARKNENSLSVSNLR